LDTYHPDSLYLHEQECEDPSFFDAKRGPPVKKLGKQESRGFMEEKIPGHCSQPNNEFYVMPRVF
jgi:hypothetical protein